MMNSYVELSMTDLCRVESSFCYLKDKESTLYMSPFFNDVKLNEEVTLTVFLIKRMKVEYFEKNE